MRLLVVDFFVSQFVSMQCAKSLTCNMVLVSLSMNYELHLRLYLFVFTARPEYT